ncbi:MAG: endolytic transglycosylase MltG [Pseudomonadota bacterium]
MKRALLLLVVIALAGFAGAAWQIDRFLNSPINLAADSQTFEIAPGSPFTRVANDLEAAGVIDSALLLRLYARITDKAGSVQAGEYEIRADATPVDLIDQFIRGEVRLYSFTIIEGWNRWELLNALQANDHLDATLTDEDWASLLQELGAEESHPEGLFLPETYRFPRGASDRAILAQAYGLMKTTLAEEWENRSEKTKVDSPYAALILASIIEKETGRADERQRISGVFSRRLDIGMRLQTDPTIIYGIGADFNGDITRRDLRTDTPYNTYTRNGLPPTPIAMPGRDSIYAALNPAEGKEMYFVATGTGDGGHIFSETREEHEAAVQVYLQEQRRRLQGNP